MAYIATLTFANVHELTLRLANIVDRALDCAFVMLFIPETVNPKGYCPDRHLRKPLDFVSWYPSFYPANLKQIVHKWEHKIVSQ